MSQKVVKLSFLNSKFTIVASVLLSVSQVHANDALAELMKKYSDQIPTIKEEKKKVEASAPENKLSKSKKTKRNEVQKPDEKLKYTIQVASYSEQYDADRKLKEITEMGFDAFLSEGMARGKKRYRVNIGSFTTKKAAQVFAKSRLDPEGIRKFIFTNSSASLKVETRQPASVTEAKPSLPQQPVEKQQLKNTQAEGAKADADSDNESSTSSGLFGDWGGVKRDLSKKGINLDLKYKGDMVRNFSGGLETKSDYLGHVDVLTEFNLEELASVKGLTLVLYALGDHGGHPKEFIGDSFATSSIEAPNTFKLYEAYAKQTLDERSTFLLGLRDLNADYYVAPSSSGLINSAFGIGPSLSQTGVNGPSIFPFTSLAITFRYESPTGFYFQSGAFNATAGNPGHPYGTQVTSSLKNGYLYIWETGLSGSKDEKAFKYGFGAWNYSKPIAAIDSSIGDQSNSGVYLLMDQQLTDSFGIFAKYGTASEKVNKFKTSAEAGFILKGRMWGREDDKINFGLAHVSVSEKYKDMNASKGEELAAEINYRFKLREGGHLDSRLSVRCESRHRSAN